MATRDIGPTDQPHAALSGAYRLIGIGPVAAPSGSEGQDWLQYRIGQGNNVVTGYRRGNIHNVTRELHQVVEDLNERNLVHRGRVNLTTRYTAEEAKAAALRKGL